MGLDGGTKITRSDVLRGSSWRLATADTSRSTRGGAISTTSVHQEKQQKASTVKKNRLSTCFLSSSELCCPVVCDYVGNVHNKANVVEFLLWKKNKLEGSSELRHKYQNISRIHGEELNHLKSLKDVLDINLVPGNLKREDSAVGSLQAGCVVSLHTMQCPVLHNPFDKHRLVLLPPCGHVLSQEFQLMQLETASDSLACPVIGCGAEYKDCDVIELAPELGSDEHKVAVARLKEREAYKLAISSSKKRKQKQIESGGKGASQTAPHSIEPAVERKTLRQSE